MLGFAEGGRIYVPLEETSRGLGLGIALRPGLEGADGFYLTEARRFSLDRAAGRVESGGAAFALEPGAVLRGQTDLFVDLASLDTWLEGVELTYRPQTLEIGVVTDIPLPELARRARERERRRGGGAATDGPPLPPVAPPFRPLGPPVFDVSGQIDVGRGATRYVVDIVGAQDLLWSSAAYAVRVNEEGLTDARVLLVRRDPAGGLPLGLTEVQVGDVAPLSVPLLESRPNGLGVRLSNRRSRQSEEVSRTEFRGPLPPGWEAELYENDILIAAQPAPIDGEYVFSDVPLTGNARFRILLFGPQGQRQERVEIVRLTGNTPPEGRLRFAAAATLDGRDAVPITRARGTRRENGATLRARFAYGLTPTASLTGTVALAREDEEDTAHRDRLVLGLGTEFGLGETTIVADAAVTADGAAAGGAELRTAIGRVSLLAGHASFARDFPGPREAGDERIVRRSVLRASGRVPVPATHQTIGLSLAASHVAFENGGGAVDAAIGMSARVGAVSLSHDVALDLPLPEEGDGVLQGDGILALAVRPTEGPELRASLGYGLAPEAALERLSAELRWPLGDEGTLSALLEHVRGEGIGARIGGAIVVGPAELGADLDYQAGEGVGLRTSLRFSFDPVGTGPLVARGPLARRATGVATVFIDRDGDGLFGPGDEPVPGARLRSGREGAAADQDGRLRLPPLSDAGQTRVELDRGSLPDPFLAPTVQGYAASGRPGAPLDLPFPLVYTADIEGSVTLIEVKAGAETRRGLGNVELIVRAATGEERARLRSEFDGRYSLAGLPVGAYTVAIDAAQVARFGLVPGPPIGFELRDDTAILPGLDFELRPASSPPGALSAPASLSPPAAGSPPN